jgi:RimJ/RimL family protein N-acetyltransferase
MIGDVNLFLNDSENHSAEIEIMIAEAGSRGKGLGLEAITSMMRYGQKIFMYTVSRNCHAKTGHKCCCCRLC